MSSPRVRELSPETLETLAGLAEQGGVAGGLPSLRVQQLVPVNERSAVTAVLADLEQAGVSGGTAVASALRLAAEARRAGMAAARPQLVWSQFDIPGAASTAAVARRLFSEADHTVVLSTYSIGHWAEGDEPPHNPVLVPLAERMEAVPGLKVRLFLNIARRKALEGAPSSEVVQDFRWRFLKYVWPTGARLPAIYYDPRSLDRSDAVLHAKCIVVDDAKAFITSANLTEAAQDENIEAGVLLEDAVFAKALRQQFDALIDAGLVRRLEMERT